MDFIRMMVRGTIWKCRMDNDAVFEWWTPYVVTRAEARKELLAISNGDYQVYTNKEIASIWKTK